MKPSIIFLLAAFSLSILIIAPAKSEIILVVATKDNKHKLYLDTDSVTFDRNFVEASITTRNRNPSDGVSSSTVRWKVNCSYRSKMFVEAAYHDLNGNFLWSNRKPSGWGAIIPGSIGENIYYSMCNRFRQ